MMDFKVVSAQSEEREKIAKVFERARIFKQSLGDVVWGDMPFTSKDIDLMARDGHLYVAKINREIAGGFMLTPKDTHNWGKETGDDQHALYVHLLVTDLAYRGRGIGEKMINWACDKAREQNRPFVRLDCSRENKDLCDYYEKQAFVAVGLGQKGSVVLYQRAV